MCFGGGRPPADNSAELAQKRAEQRELLVREGRGKVEDAFAQFDAPFFTGVQTDFENSAFPQIDNKFQDARRKVVLGLASTGNLNSGSGARTLGDLQAQFEQERQRAGNDAVSQTNQFRSDVERQKNSLFDQNARSADPSAIAAQAAASVGTLQAPQASIIGPVFRDFINQFSNNVALERQGRVGTGTGLFGSDTRNGSVRTIGA